MRLTLYLFGRKEKHSLSELINTNTGRNDLFTLILGLIFGVFFIPLTLLLGATISPLLIGFGLVFSVAPVLIAATSIKNTYFCFHEISKIGKDSISIEDEHPVIAKLLKDRPVSIEFLQTLNQHEYDILTKNKNALNYLLNEEEQPPEKDRYALIEFKVKFQQAMMIRQRVVERLTLLSAYNNHHADDVIIPNLRHLIQTQRSLEDFKQEFARYSHKGPYTFRDYKDRKGNTLAHLAAINKRDDLVDFLASQGMDLNLKNVEGKNAREILAENNKTISHRPIASGAGMGLFSQSHSTVSMADIHTPLLSSNTPIKKYGDYGSSSTFEEVRPEKICAV